LFMRDQLELIQSELTRLQTGLVGLASKNADTIMPGFTHLQVAQPVTFGHHLLAWFEMLKRDSERFTDCAKARQCHALRLSCIGRYKLPY
jgi:argininosuccinate lyase (EC 4.3.2.1)